MADVLVAEPCWLLEIGGFSLFGDGGTWPCCTMDRGVSRDIVKIKNLGRIDVIVDTVAIV